MPLVSVIMNVRNGASFLREALDSVLAQTFVDWELIVWDDCSTDNSAQIVSQYRDPRIRYFLSPEDTPLGKARDSAIRRASGEWLASGLSLGQRFDDACHVLAAGGPVLSTAEAFRGRRDAAPP